MIRWWAWPLTAASCIGSGGVLAQAINPGVAGGPYALKHLACLLDPAITDASVRVTRCRAERETLLAEADIVLRRYAGRDRQAVSYRLARGMTDDEVSIVKLTGEDKGYTPAFAAYAECLADRMLTDPGLAKGLGYEAAAVRKTCKSQRELVRTATATPAERRSRKDLAWLDGFISQIELRNGTPLDR